VAAAEARALPDRFDVLGIGLARVASVGPAQFDGARGLEKGDYALLDTIP
jgi:hypothetical protein